MTMSRNEANVPRGEHTPLLPPPATSAEHSPDEETNPNASNQSVTLIRACCIIASLGVLIFFQGRYVLRLLNIAMPTLTMTRSMQHLRIDDGAIQYRGGSGCICGNKLVYFGVSCRFCASMPIACPREVWEAGLNAG